MRWYWIDRFVEFVSGERAVTVKNVSMGESHLHEYWPGYPIMPSSLMVEGMAQTGGLLVGETQAWQHSVVLAKVSKASFECVARPGDVLQYTAILQDVRPDGGLVQGTVHCNGKELGVVNLVFACLTGEMADVNQFYDADFINLLRSLGLYDVGVTADGEKLLPPSHLAAAEESLAANLGL